MPQPITLRLLVPGGPCSNCRGAGSLPAATYSVGGSDRLPCGVCLGLGVRLVEPPASAAEVDFEALGGAALDLRLAPDACDGGLPSSPPACGRAPWCPTCHRCRAHCRCTAGADLRGSR